MTVAVCADDGGCNLKSDTSSRGSNSPERPLMAMDDPLMDAFAAARQRLLFNKDPSEVELMHLDSMLAAYSFIYYLKIFSAKCTEYWELYAMYVNQRDSSRWRRCTMHCEFSLIRLIWPLPYLSWRAFLKSFSPFLHWRSPEFLQALSLSLACTICSIFFIYPPLREYNSLGYWCPLTVGMQNDTVYALHFALNTFSIHILNVLFGFNF